MPGAARAFRSRLGVLAPASRFGRTPPLSVSTLALGAPRRPSLLIASPRLGCGILDYV